MPIALPCFIAWRTAESVSFEFRPNFGIRFVVEKDLEAVFGDVVDDFAAIEFDFQQLAGFFNLSNLFLIVQNQFDPFFDPGNFLIVVT